MVQNMLLSWAQRCGAEVRPRGRTRFGAAQCKRLAVHAITTPSPLGEYVLYGSHQSVSTLMKLRKYK